MADLKRIFSYKVHAKVQKALIKCRHNDRLTKGIASNKVPAKVQNCAQGMC